MKFWSPSADIFFAFSFSFYAFLLLFSCSFSLSFIFMLAFYGLKHTAIFGASIFDWLDLGYRWLIWICNRFSNSGSFSFNWKVPCCLLFVSFRLWLLFIIFLFDLIYCYYYFCFVLWSYFHALIAIKKIIRFYPSIKSTNRWLIHSKSMGIAFDYDAIAKSQWGSSSMPTASNCDRVFYFDLFDFSYFYGGLPSFPDTVQSDDTQQKEKRLSWWGGGKEEGGETVETIECWLFDR